MKLDRSPKGGSVRAGNRPLMASGPVVSGQTALQLEFPSSLKGQKISAYATLQGAGYLPVTDTLTITVT
jgi:hypothetical protein